jgi:hypothetical protein
MFENKVMRKYLFLLTWPVLIFIGCKKEFSTFYTSNTYSSLKEFFSTNAKPSEYFVVNSSKNISLKTKGGSIITFEKNSFVDSLNQPVPGDVNIEVKEILTPAEMIYNQVYPVSDGKLLESGGQFYIHPKKNSKSLKLAPGKQVQIMLPNLGISMGGMRVFNGRPTNSGTGSSVNWKINNNPGNVVAFDSLNFSGLGALSPKKLFSDSIEWVNCDKFVYDQKISYLFIYPNPSEFDEIAVFVVFNGRNALASLGLLTNTSMISSNYLVSRPATIVALARKGKKLFASINSTTLVNGGSTTLNFIEYSAVALKAKLSNTH